MKLPDYLIYPSLLDTFQKFMNSEQEFEDFGNEGDDGYKRTLADIQCNHECDLIDMINRCKTEPIEACDKGTALNEIVDCIIENRKSSRDNLEIISVAEPIFDNDQKPIIDEATGEQKKLRYVIAKINGFEFKFDTPTCETLANLFSGSLTQFYAQADITIHEDKKVRLYGYLDYYDRDKVYDLKTTSSSYSFPRFDTSWQKVVYPWCLVASGMATEISEFDYIICQLNKPSDRTPIMSGKIYKEPYDYDHTKATIKLRQGLERFTEWVESRKDYITDKRIFAGINKAGYFGEPIDRVQFKVDNYEDNRY